MRPWVVLTVWLAVAAASCARVGAPNESAPTPSPSPARPTPQRPTESRLAVGTAELDGQRVEIWHPWFGVEADLLQTLVDEFNAGNEWGILVAATGHANLSSLFENVAATSAGAGSPDVVVALPEHAIAWHEQSRAVDLSPYVGDPVYGIDGSDFPILFWNQDLVGGARLALPAQRSARFLLWNASLAGELGFDSPPSTAEDFQAQTCAANQRLRSDATPQNDRQGGWLIQTDAMTAYGWLLAFQGSVLEGNDYRFLSPRNIAAFEFLKALQQETCAWLVEGTETPRSAFAERKAIIRTAGLEDLTAQTRAFSTAANADEWRAISFPGDAVVPVYGTSYVLLKSSAKRQLAAWVFVRWLTEPGQDRRWVEGAHLLPLRRSTIPLLATYRSAHPQWAEAVELLEVGHLQPQLASWRTLKVMLEDGFTCLLGPTPLCQQAPVVLAQMESTSRELSD